MSALRFFVVVLLFGSAVNLALMVPGGVVETRDFGAYPTYVLGAFNVFLTVLGMGSLILAYVVARIGRGYVWATLAGLAFFAVYVADLGQIFPVTTSPMSPLLRQLEWGGIAAGALLTLIALRAIKHARTPLAPSARAVFPWPAVAALLVISLIIVAFATMSAMGV